MVRKNRPFGVIGGKRGRIKNSEMGFVEVDGRLLEAHVFADSVPVSGASSSAVKKRKRDEVAIEFRRLQRAHEECSDDKFIRGTGS